MVRVIDVCSGKGGVGKTVVATNLAATLQGIGKRVAVIDCNLTTAHMGLHLGMHKNTNTLNNYLRNEVKLEDTLYDHVTNIKVVPASLEVRDLIDIDSSRMKDDIKRVFADYDYVILDSAPGLGKEALIAMNASDELLFVATPHVPSLVDIAKYTHFAEKIGHNPIGVVLNRVKNKKYEIKPEDVLYFTELPLLNTIPEDESVLKSVNEKKLVVHNRPKAKSSKAFKKLGHKIAGIDYKEKSFLSSIPSLFRRKKVVHIIAPQNQQNVV
ncbi:cell division ATPase MinD [Candidatus Aenigmatarchaeota archaeon]